MKTSQDIKNEIKELKKEADSIFKGMDKLSEISERDDLYSPKESAWRQLNNIFRKINSLEWVLEG